MTASEKKELLQSIMTDFCEHCIGRCIECEYLEVINDASKALDLLELKEQNRIIELPVPIGSEMFILKNFKYDTRIKKGFLREINISEFGTQYIVDSIGRGKLGEKVFATREEAEKRLAELRGE